MHRLLLRLDNYPKNKSQINRINSRIYRALSPYTQTIHINKEDSSRHVLCHCIFIYYKFEKRWETRHILSETYHEMDKKRSFSSTDSEVYSDLRTTLFLRLTSVLSTKTF